MTGARCHQGNSACTRAMPTIRENLLCVQEMKSLCDVLQRCQVDAFKAEESDKLGTSWESVFADRVDDTWKDSQPRGLIKVDTASQTTLQPMTVQLYQQGKCTAKECSNPDCLQRQCHQTRESGNKISRLTMCSILSLFYRRGLSRHHWLKNVPTVWSCTSNRRCCKS